MSFHVLYYALLVWAVVGVNCQGPEVEIPQGRLRGDTRTNRDGGTYYSFKKIPYAKPPVGELRFKAPQAPEPWEGTRDATEELPMCIQMEGEDVGQGQEDCLFLNLYTPELPGEDVALKPVMVFIYGGSFLRGSGVESDTGAQYLLTKDVLLVVPNFRLGILGYLSLDDPDLGVTGNAGMKDLVQALQWIHDNIEHFGGDPNNVMLFGESVGSMIVHLQVLSPLTNGLIHKAISQSGQDLNKHLTTPHARNTGAIVAEVLGIQTDNWEEMLISLQNESADALIEAANQFDHYFALAFPEMKGSNQPTLFTDEIIDIIRSGDYNHIPYIMGFTDVEGLTYAISEEEQTGSPWVVTDFTPYVPVDFALPAGSEEEAIVAERIKRFYYGDSEPSPNDISQIIDLSTDDDFAFPAYRSAVEHLKTAKSSLYFFVFGADTELNISKQGNNVTYPGAAHGDDLAYMFPKSRIELNIAEGSVEDLAIKRVVDLWTNFAYYSDPTPEAVDGFKWEPLTEDQFNYAFIGTEASFSYVNPNPERFAFWSELFEEYFEN